MNINYNIRWPVLFLLSILFSTVFIEKVYALTVWIGEKEVIDNGRYDSDSTNGVIRVILDNGKILTDCIGTIEVEETNSTNGNKELKLTELSMYNPSFGGSLLGCGMPLRAETSRFSQVTNTDLTSKLDVKSMFSAGTNKEYISMKVYDRCGFKNPTTLEVNLQNQNRSREWNENGPINCLGMSLYVNLPDKLDNMSVNGKITCSNCTVPNPTGGDYWIEDTPYNYGGPPDLGREPDPNMDNHGMWMSKAMWVRNNPNNPGPHQNPEYGQENEIYVRVRNKGTQIIPSASLRVSWAYAATGLSLNPVEDPYGRDNWNVVDEVALPEILPGHYFDAKLSWWPPSPKGNNGHFCLISEVEGTNDNITFLTNYLDTYVRHNNNVAWRNVNIIDAQPDKPKPSFDFTIRNITEDKAKIRLLFRISDKKNDAILPPHKIVLKNLEALSSRIIGFHGGEFQQNPLSFTITDKEAYIDFEAIEVGEEQDLNLTLDDLLFEIPRYNLCIEQSHFENGNEIPDGGICNIVTGIDLISFEINKSSNNTTSILWKTGYEINNVGFRLWRGTMNENNELVNFTLLGKESIPIKIGDTNEVEICGTNLECIKDKLENVKILEQGKEIQPKGSEREGADYKYLDTNVNHNKQTYYYLLEDLNTKGDRTFHWDFLRKTN